MFVQRNQIQEVLNTLRTLVVVSFHPYEHEYRVYLHKVTKETNCFYRCNYGYTFDERYEGSHNLGVDWKIKKNEVDVLDRCGYAEVISEFNDKAFDQVVENMKQKLLEEGIYSRDTILNSKTVYRDKDTFNYNLTWIDMDEKEYNKLKESKMVGV